MKRPSVLVIVPLAVAGLGAVVLHKKNMLGPATFASPAAAQKLGPVGPPGPVTPTVVGMNVGGLEYYSGEWAFNDLVMNAGFISFSDPKGGWKDPEGFITLDATGHPVNVPSGTSLPIVLQGGLVRFRSGSYDCSIPDGWSLRVWGDWTMKGSGKRFTMTVADKMPHGGVTMIMTATKNNAAINAMSCLKQGVDTSTPFNPDFLAETRPYKVLRFMSWMRPNNQPRQTWAGRPTPAFFTQGSNKGVSLEYMVALANTNGTNPWFTMPFDADAEYYANFATYVRDHLDPKLKVYVEFSNEVWNEAFEQGKTATQRGRQAYPGIDPVMANDYYYADRVRDLMAVWSKVFAGQQQRLVRVLANQAVWAERADRALAHKDTWKSVDVVAIAPYFSTDPYSLPGTGAARVDATFQRSSQIVGAAITNAINAKKVANKYKLPLVAYEAGPSFVGYQKEISDDMLAVDRDPRMYNLYTSFLKRWQAEVGGLIVLFDSVSTPGPGGHFGHQDYTGQPLSEAPKARAVHDFMKQLEK